MKIGLPTLGALVATFILASISSTPADARTICKGSGTNAQCYTVKTKKKLAKRAKAARYAQRARTSIRTARLNRDDYPWHGWGASFHLDGMRYAGGNRSGPAAAHNNFEGGFHPTAFWKLSDRAGR
jgi:hypothetical protein